MNLRRFTKQELMGINFKNYQAQTNMVKDEWSELPVDFHSIFNRWKSHFRHLLNAHGINEVMKCIQLSH
jgi:hypothetical protein